MYIYWFSSESGYRCRRRQSTTTTTTTPDTTVQPLGRHTANQGAIKRDHLYGNVKCCRPVGCLQNLLPPPHDLAMTSRLHLVPHTMCEVKFGLKFVPRPKFGLRLWFKPLDLAEVDLTQRLSETPDVVWTTFLSCMRNVTQSLVSLRPIPCTEYKIHVA